MTNESKAIEIYNRETDKGFHLGTHSLMEMAEWKDQQFKEYLEKKKDSLEMDYHKDSYECNAYKYSLLMEIINELFKEE